MTTETPTPEGVLTTLRDYLRVATATGELRGTRIEFSPDGGDTWGEVLVRGHMLVARATVYRAGWEIPTVLVVLWDEALPADEHWRERWDRAPQVLFGAFALRAALIRTFADVFGDRREPDDFPDGGAAPRPADIAAPAPVQRIDWLGELAAATTSAALVDLYARAGKARVAPATFLAIQRRLREMQAEEANASANRLTAEQTAAAFSSADEPEPVGEVSEQEWLARIETAASDEAIDDIRHTLRAQPDGVTEAQHAAMKRRTRELASAPLTNAVALAMRDAVAKASVKPTPLTAAVAARTAARP